MTAVAVLAAAALAVAGPDLVTIAGVLRGRVGHRVPRVGWLVGVVVATHTALVVAGLSRGMS